MDCSLEQVEKRHIVEVLTKTEWVIEGPRGAAKLLGLHPNTLTQPHEAAWYRAFFVTAPPRNIVATKLPLASPTKTSGFPER